MNRPPAVHVRVNLRVEETSLVLAAHEGEDLLEILQRGGCTVTTACGGVASCGLCRVEVLGGSDALSARRSYEEVHVSAPRDRLACQARIRPAGNVQEILLRVPNPIESEPIE